MTFTDTEAMRAYKDEQKLKFSAKYISVTNQSITLRESQFRVKKTII